MKKLFLLITILTSQVLVSQTRQPLVVQPHLIWQNPDGSSGECYNQSGGQTPLPICSTTICLGESICFSYSIEFSGNCDYIDYNCNHDILYFSDGGQITVENINYQGPNPTGCVNYAPTTTGLITTTGVNGIPFNIYVLPNTPPTLSAIISPANPVCQGSQICAQSLTNPIINYDFSSTTDISCTNPVPCNTPNTTPFCFPVGNHQILYTVNAGHTCSNTATYSVSVISSSLSLTVSNTSTCTNNYCLSVTPTNTCNLGNISYQWTINGNTTIQTTNNNQSFCADLIPGVYYASVEAIGSNPLLYEYVTFTVNPINACACYTCNSIGTGGIISSSPTPNEKYCINNNVTINGNISFLNSEFKIGANINITIPNGATLTIDNSHLFAGTNMWTGIIIQNGGKLNVVNNSLIEEAITAVSIINHSNQNQILNIDASIFNKNHTDVRIADYIQNITTYPFTITNSLFTCRQIVDCYNNGIWPATSIVKAATNPTNSPLETPYINNNTYPVTTLKAPYAGKKSFYGITLTNVGFSNVTTTSSSYQEIMIGTTTGINTYNLFDNHWIAISANNSNIKVTNTIFQNGFNLAFPSLYSIGIKIITSGQNCRLQANSTSYTNNCKFYDLTRAIYTQSLHDLNINYCEMYSTRVFNPGSASQYGAYGVSATSNHYRNIELNNNKIFNIDNGLVFNATVGSYTVGTTIGNGQYLGSINANNNIIRSHVTGYTPNPSLHYGFKAITLSSILGQANVTQAGQVVNTNNNTIYDYENGIFCSNWPLHLTVSESNNVTIRNAATVVQYGIEHDNNSDGSTGQATFNSHGIRSNFVTATSISTNPSNYAIRSSQNTASAVRCNTVSNTYNGIAYSGTAVQGSFFYYNDFNGNNKYGFVLENAGVIGQQGAIDLGPTDNRWLGTSWVSPNYKTATLGTSSAVGSRVYIRLTPDFNPHGSAFTNGSQNVTDYYYNGTLGTLRQGNNASYIACNWAKPLATANNTILTVNNKFGNTTQDINLMEEIVMSQSTNNEQAQALSIAKEQVFVQLKETPDAMLNSVILSNFYNNILNSNTDALASVAQDIAQGDKNIAQLNLTTVSPQNINEIKHKQFLDLLLKFSNQPLSVSDEQQLLSIASGCPSLEGTFVHEARTLYNVAFDKNNSFIDNCVVAVNNARMANSQDTKVTDEQFGNSVLLYPNPSAIGAVTILTNADTDVLDVEINAIDGFNLIKQSVSLSNHSAKLSFNAAAGVYMVIITNPKTKQRVIKKLVIQ